MILKNIFKKKDSLPFKLEEGHVIEKAFIKDGVQYYQLHDMFNTFTQRGMDALAVYESWGMRCSRQFLIDHTKAVDTILRDPKKINVMDIGQLNSMLKERLEWALPTEEIIWQFMAVAYFDEKESPYKYDNKYGEDKIKRWKEGYKIEDFFLSVPISNLIPLPNISAEDLSLLLTTIGKMDQKHSEKITSTLSSNQQSRGSSTKSGSVKNTELIAKN